MNKRQKRSRNTMTNCARIAVVGFPNLMSDIIREALECRPGFDVVVLEKDATDPDCAAQLDLADVVVGCALPADARSLGSLVFGRRAGMRVFGLASDGDALWEGRMSLAVQPID